MEKRNIGRKSKTAEIPEELANDPALTLNGENAGCKAFKE